MRRRRALAAVALALLGAVTSSRAVDIRGYLQTGSYATGVDSVVFHDSSGVPTTYPTHGWGGTPESEDSFDFIHVAAWPAIADLYSRVIPDSTVFNTYLRVFIPDTWYQVNIHPAWNEPYVMFTTNPHASVVGPAAARAAGLSLAPGRPNPFADRAAISFANDADGWLELAVLNAAGTRVKTLASGRFRAGTHLVVWPAADERHRAVPDGVYFCRLTDGKVILTHKLALQR